MVVYRLSPTAALDCPGSGCDVTEVELEKLKTHIKAVHSPQKPSIIQQQATTSNAMDIDPIGEVLVPPGAPPMLGRDTVGAPALSFNDNQMPLDAADAPPASATILHPARTQPPIPELENYLTSHPLLARLGLRIHAYLQVVICIGCETCRLPSAIVGHIKRHGIIVDKLDAAELQVLLDAYGVHQHNKVLPPAPGGPPIPGIKIYEHGLCCTRCTSCFLTRGSVIHHWSVDHPGAKVKTEGKYQNGAVQTLFNPIPIRYFQVDTLQAKYPSGSLFDIFMREELPKVQSERIAPPIREQEVPILLQMTEWHLHVADWAQDRQKCQTLCDLVILPRGLHNKGIGRLNEVVFDYMVTIRNAAQKTPLGIRCLLMECPRCVNLTLH